MPLIVGENTYVSLKEADAYLSRKQLSGGWIRDLDYALDLPELIAFQEEILIEATAALDRLGFNGSIARYDQPLAWPRMRMRDREGRSIPSNVVPQAVRDATCELALHLLSKPEAKPASAVARKRVGDLEIQYRATLPDPVLPIVRQLLAPFLAGSPYSVELIP